jgi:hypothetical protein
LINTRRPLGDDIILCLSLTMYFSFCRKDIDDTNPAHEVYASKLFAQIMELIEAKALDSTLDFFVRLNLQNFAKQFKVNLLYMSRKFVL